MQMRFVILSLLNEYDDDDDDDGWQVTTFR